MKGSSPSACVGAAIAVIDLEMQHIAQHQREDDAVTVNGGAAEHASRRDVAEAVQLVLQEIEEVLTDGHIGNASRFADRRGTEPLTPH